MFFNKYAIIRECSPDSVGKANTASMPLEDGNDCKYKKPHIRFDESEINLDFKSINWFHNGINYCLIYLICWHSQCHYRMWIYYFRSISILNHTWTADVTIDTGRNTVANNISNNCIKLPLTKSSQVLETLLLSMAKKILANSNHCTECRGVFVLWI